MEHTDSIGSLPRAGEAQSLQPRSRSVSGFDKLTGIISDKLKTAADTLRNKAAEGNGQNNAVVQYGRQAATWLDSSADYVRDLDIDQIKTNVKDHVRQNPGRTLLIAGAAGLLLGALVRRR